VSAQRGGLRKADISGVFGAISDFDIVVVVNGGEVEADTCAMCSKFRVTDLAICGELDTW
jgi:hypothetical protein